jgi:fumarylpyruvate hydrolase
MSWVIEPPPQPALAIEGSTLFFPVTRIFCVGRNYAAHAREMGASEREEPFFFAKPSLAATQAGEIPFPPMTHDLHHEVELVVALGRGGSDLSLQQAEECIYGHAVGVDLTRRDLQDTAKQKRRPWTLAKGFDHSAPLSRIVPLRPGEHVAARRIELAVNGVRRQCGTTADMIWPVPELLSKLSNYLCLQPGDLVFTGTPSGVARLEPGDRVDCRIENLARHSFRLTRPGSA